MTTHRHTNACSYETNGHFILLPHDWKSVCVVKCESVMMGARCDIVVKIIFSSADIL